MDMDHWCNDTDKEKRKYSDENILQYQFFQHKSHARCPGIEPGLPTTDGLSYDTAEENLRSINK
jgi:hypothetical protein